MRLTKEQIEQFFSGPVWYAGMTIENSEALRDSLRDLALLGLTQEQNNAAAAPVDRPTPRTDELWAKGHFTKKGAAIAWAKQLERELAEAKRDVNTLNNVLREAGWGQGEIDHTATMVEEKVDGRIAELEAKIARMRPSKEALEAAIHYQNKMRVPDATGILARALLRINEEAK